MNIKIVSIPTLVKVNTKADFTAAGLRLALLIGSFSLLISCDPGTTVTSPSTVPILDEASLAPAPAEEDMTVQTILGKESMQTETKPKELPPLEKVESTLKSFADGPGRHVVFMGQGSDLLFGKFERVSLFHNGKNFVTLDCERESMDGPSIQLSYLLPDQVDEQPIILQLRSWNSTYMEGSFVNYDNEPTKSYYFNEGNLIAYEWEAENQPINKLAEIGKDSAAIIEQQALEMARGIMLAKKEGMDFSGSWVMIDNTDGHKFSVDLRQIGSIVFGSYCGYTPTRYDCIMESQGGSPCFVQGKIESDTLRLQFAPCYTKGIGTAKLFFQEEQLVWKTTYRPEGFSSPPSEGRLE